MKDSAGTAANLTVAPGEDEVLVFPVSFAQQRLWVLDRLEPNSAFYNMPMPRRLTGALDTVALEKSLNAIVQRHEVLRTTFLVRDEQPVQVVVPALRIELPLTDLGYLPVEQREEEARRIANAEAKQPFDLSRGPLFRASLLRLSAEDHVLLLNTHHIVSDGWSQGVLTEELTALYEAFSQGKPSPLAELPIQYADFALWQRDWLQGEVLDQQVAHWKEQLQGAPPLLEIATDRPRPAVESFRGDAARVQISPGTTEKLKALSRREGVTLFMTLLAAFDVLLSRYSGQEDIVVGTPIANRNRPEIESLIGFFANTLALRSDLSGNPTFRELLSRVREVALKAYAHQDLPFEKLVEVLRPERSLSHNPLFQVLFALQNQPKANREMPGLKMQPFGAKVGTAKVDISLFMIERPDGLSGTLEYNTDIFDASTIERLIGHFQNLLEGIVEDPTLRLSELPLLSHTERHQLLVEWNQTDHDYPHAVCVHQLFEAQAERTPEATAVSFGQQSLTYRELNRKANQLAHTLLKHGVGRGHRVGLYLDRSLEMMVGLLGVQKSGAAYVPLDPDYPPERVRLTLEDAEVSAIVSQKNLLGSLPDHSAKILCLDSDWARIAQESASNVNADVSPDDLIYVIFTSGSTGRPKGVQISHRAVVNLLAAMTRELNSGEKDVLVALASFAFDMSVPELYLLLVNGGRVVIGAREIAGDGKALAALLEKEGATIIHVTPTTWNLLLQAGYSGAGRKRAVGAEPLPKELCARLLEADHSLYNFYGPTETTVWSTVHHFRSPDEALTVGRPLANTQIYILDKYQQPVPIGVVGELYIGGNGVANGYLKRPDLTSERFVFDLFSKRPGTKLYRTGDLARYLPDGRIDFLGRSDNQVKLRGFRIELGEIETVLTQHPTVQQAVVIVREDAPGDKRLVAYLIPSLGHTPDSHDLREFAKEKLPEYMLPSRFVTVDRLPLSPNGKVDRKALPAPDASRPEIEGQYVAPRTPVEEAVAGIWAEVLHLNQVGAHDEFFALGGHSLLAAQVMSRITQAFQVEIPLRALFEASTVAGLSKRIEQARSAERGLLAPPIVRVSRNRDLPLSFSQQRLWLLDQLQPDNPIYNVAQAIRLTGTLDIALLKRSLNELLRRHEVLRTGFAMAEDTPIQIIAPASELEVEMGVIDISGVPAERREDEARRLAMQEGQRGFNLKTGPMLRAGLIRFSPEEHVLLLNMHHIVSDRWSLGVLSRDLAAVYRAFAAGKPSPLPELAIQYADFAVWQREWLQGEILERQLAYWKTQLADAPPMLELATDRPRPAVESFRGSASFTIMPPELSQKLKALSRREGVTLFMTLLAAFDVLLWRYSGQEDIIVGSPIANRNRTEVEDLIGFFVNTLVLRSDLSGNPTFRELLVRVREVALNAYAHQDLPFEKLVEELRLERSLSHNPLFQVMFALQNAPAEKLQLPGLTLSGFPVQSTRSMFDLTMFVTESERGLLTRLEYNTDLFDARTITRMLERFQGLLEAFVSNPDQRIADGPVLSRAERRHLLEELNATQSEYPSDTCVHQLFGAQVQRTPDAIALMFNGEAITYRALNDRANRLAQYLHKRGARPDKLVGIYIERSVEMLVALLGVLKAGAAYVPLDPAYPKDRIAFIAEDARLDLLLTQQSLVEHAPSSSAQFIRLDADWPMIAAESVAAPAVDVHSNNLAYVLYTSGSTGKPKGVQIEHRSLVNFLVSMQREPGLASQDVLLAETTLSFDIAGLELFLPLSVGARILLATREEAADGAQLRRRLEREAITVMQATPATWRLLIEADWNGTPQLKILCGGEALPRDLAEQLLPRCRELWNVYGPTETTVWSSVYRVKDANWSMAPIGRPVANTQYYVLDKQRQPLALGVAGELYIGGDGLARGYWNRPDLTSERFIPDPFRAQPGARLYRTGDLVRYLPDGNIQYLGRLDNQVKVRGFRIELGEIESVLTQHSAIQQAVVTVREDNPGDKRLVGYLIADEPAPSSEELRAHLKQALPEYMIPSAFVTLESFPLTPNGKVDRRALPPPDYSAQGSVAGVAPRDEHEELLLGIWQKILGTASIGVKDNFFEIGGHSLLAVRLLAEIKKATGMEIPLAALFQGATIEYLANLLRGDSGMQSTEMVVQIQGKGIRPPFFAMVSPGANALGYLQLSRYLGDDQPFYKIQGPGPALLKRPYTPAEFDRMAMEYVQALRHVQPHGPYYIGGMCEGARIAFDMARHLEAAGEKVQLLAIFDTWVLENSQNRLLWYFYYAGQRLRAMRRLTPSERAKLVSKIILNVSRRLFRAKAQRAPWPVAYWPGKGFVPDMYGADITVFKIPKQPFYYVRDPFMGWASRTTGMVNIYNVAARHNLMLREPYVQDLARQLRRCLNGLQEESLPYIPESAAQVPQFESASCSLASADSLPSIEPAARGSWNESL